MRSIRKFVKVFAGALLLAAAGPMVAFGSPARMAGMNLDQSTYWMIGIDETLFTFNPAILAELKPQVWGQVAPTLQGGLILNLIPDVNLYIISGLPMSFTEFAAIPAPALNATQEQIRLGASLNLGQVEFGATAMFTGTGQTNDGTGAVSTNTVVDLGLGTIIILDPKKMNVDVAVDAKLWSIFRETAAGTQYDALTFDISALGRLNWVLLPDNEFHLMAGFGMKDRSYTPAAGGKVTNGSMSIQAGLSDEINFTKEIKVYAGGLFNTAIVSNENPAADTVTLTLDAMAGLEIAPVKELYIRTGVRHNFWRTVIDNNAGTTTTTPPGTPTTFACGLGLLPLENLLIDVQVNYDIFVGGPQFISGSAIGNGGNISLSLAVSYYFGPSHGAVHGTPAKKSAAPAPKKK